uniref:NADH dehydrogenase subunit 6 n=1 Tax=Habrophlebiodes zijinensis TaxID=289472 RepID=A0A0B4IKE5_9INSE|nr:NADH dehydrogenase subunit 6 [Habrophlebiodes zijinensis]
MVTKHYILFYLFAKSNIYFHKSPLSYSFNIINLNYFNLIIRWPNKLYILIFLHFIFSFFGGHVGFIYLHYKISIKWNILPQKKILTLHPPHFIFMMMSVNLTMKIFNFYGILTNFFINHSIYNFSLIKLFSFPSSFLTLALISYLLLTLIVIVNITNIQEGPIRHSY